MSKFISMYSGIVYTLVFIKKDSKILLGFKKRGLGVNKWNGFGGKVEKGETIFEGAIRETKEESNLLIKNLKHIGILTYEVLNKKNIDIIHVFTTNDFRNELRESEEMRPKWFTMSEVPFSEMWPDQIYWYAYMQNDNFFHSHAIYSENDELIKCEVTKFKNIEEVLKMTKLLIDENS